jgi:hypothetical protein
MTVSLKHQFVSNVADSPDATLVQPSNWNAEHTLTANANSLLGAVTAGNVVEVTCTSAGRDLLDDADAAAQRTTLGLGSISTQNANNVSITGGSITGITDLALADGGTGASDAPTARTNLGIGTIATQNSNNVSITGGSISGITDLAVADGGTGASTAAAAATNLGLGTTDSPQFLAVNIGNATDTTITRVSAAVVAVEGNTVLTASQTATITKGYTVTPYNGGTVSSGTTTPDPTNGNYQYYTNGGAHTLAAPSSDCAIDVMVINGSSGAGAITMSGFKTPGAGVSGAVYATTANTWWVLSIRRINAVSTFVWNGPWT